MDDESKVVEGESNESFAELLAGSDRVQQFARGDQVRGRVVKVTEDTIFMDLGGKSEGLLPVTDLTAGASPPALGDEVVAFVVSDGGEEGQIRLSQAMGAQHVDLDALAQAYQDHIPVQGRIKGRNKGGFDVELGAVRAFLPVSQLSREFTEDLDAHLGASYQFRITEFDRSGRNIVVSRRVLQEEEAAAKGAQLKETLVEGAILTGRVRSVLNFGAFVDLGGLDGLVHVSDMSWGRIENPAEVVSVGDVVKVKVLKIDKGKDRISLGMKQLQELPWDKVGTEFVEGGTYKGVVARLAPFGAFVELAPGLDGLIHVSNMVWSRRIAHPSEVVKEGEEVVVQILSIDAERQRISLGMKQAQGDPWDGVESRFPLGSSHEGTVERVAKFGLFVNLAEGITGLIPNREAGTTPGADHARQFPPGAKVTVSVLEIDMEQHRITLSRRQASESAEEADWKSYEKKEPKDSFGTSLGDLWMMSQKKSGRRRTKR